MRELEDLTNIEVTNKDLCLSRAARVLERTDLEVQAVLSVCVTRLDDQFN